MTKGEYRQKLARNLFEMFEMRTNRDWDDVGHEDAYPDMHKEWLESADELIKRMKGDNQ
jgi:hypothetical protein